MKVTTEENPSQGLVTFDFDEISFVHFVVEDLKSWCFLGVGVGVTGIIEVIYSNSLTDIEYMCKTTPEPCDLASKVFFINARGSKVLKYHLVAYQGDITEHYSKYHECFLESLARDKWGAEAKSTRGSETQADLSPMLKPNSTRWRYWLNVLWKGQLDRKGHTKGNGDAFDLSVEYRLWVGTKRHNSPLKWNLSLLKLSGLDPHGLRFVSKHVKSLWGVFSSVMMKGCTQALDKYLFRPAMNLWFKWHVIAACPIMAKQIRGIICANWPNRIATTGIIIWRLFQKVNVRIIW